MTELHPALVAVWRAIRPSLSDAEAREVIASQRERGAIDYRAKARSFAVLIRPDDPDAAHRAILAAFSDWLRAQDPVFPLFFDEKRHFESDPAWLEATEDAVASLGRREVAWCTLALVNESADALAAANCDEALAVVAELTEFARGDRAEMRAVGPPSERGRLIFERYNALMKSGADEAAGALMLVRLCANAAAEQIGGRSRRTAGETFAENTWPDAPRTAEHAAIIRDLFADALLSFPMPTERGSASSRHDH